MVDFRSVKNDENMIKVQSCYISIERKLSEEFQFPNLRMRTYAISCPSWQSSQY